uniref:(northern house mosquito) hypothetical protein n=1 Tax=Culex pipiens TaxID=7175 RepID=A0A8D8KZ30_CULPI
MDISEATSHSFLYEESKFNVSSSGTFDSSWKTCFSRCDLLLHAYINLSAVIAGSSSFIYDMGFNMCSSCVIMDIFCLLSRHLMFLSWVSSVFFCAFFILSSSCYF